MKKGTKIAQYLLRRVWDLRVRRFVGDVLPASVLGPIRRRLTRSAFYLAHSESFFCQVLSTRDRMDAVRDRVVLVSGSLGPGGTERQIVNTLRGLAGAGLSGRFLLCQSLATRNRSDFYLNSARATGAEVREIRPRASGRHRDRDLPAGLREGFDRIHPELAGDVANLYWEFKQLRPSVVHAWLDYSNVTAGLAAALAGVPRIILSGRCVAPWHFPVWHRPFFEGVYQALRGLPGVSILNNSHAGASDYASWLGIDASSIDVVYNGVDCPDPGPLRETIDRTRSEAPPGALVVGGMFRFYDEKRPQLWLETAAAVIAARPDVWFVLVGDGALRSEMQSIVRRLGIADRVRMPGLTAAPIQALLAMDVFLLTSLWEGTPNAALEAQWCGVPVITTQAGGAPEAISHGDTGWIVDGADPARIADRVLTTLKDRAFRTRVLAAGPRFVSGRFGLNRMIEDTLRHYGAGARLEMPQEAS